ncbi:helix-turn-helix transcriptional regulator [Streptomyces sp. LP05-1]|uniref:Helix-turn-helix transcriptional regulator n=1 Tax=Streptomyces pyxinae TaxID=2970734 RepID=A0ABT2CNT7_9ACTN|nr:helix-turn-helix transcriptional regulator [Streptomyces sp. LP05-1]MCS0638970.1 helix-turn-helix transcriptional regulator [Streptomyces sp. LP05-1]
MLREVVGRAAELERLRELLERARAGWPVTVVVRGEPGAGKSALLEALAGLAAREGFRVVAAGARGLSARPYAAADELLGRLPGGGGVPVPGEFCGFMAGARAVYGESPASGESRENRWSGHGGAPGPGEPGDGAPGGRNPADGADGAPGARTPGDGPRTPADGGDGGLEARAGRLREAVGRGPVAVVLDDADGADPRSLRWLAAPAGPGGAVPLLVALAGDGGPGRTAPPGAEHLDLDGLSAEALAELAAVRHGMVLDDEAARVCRELTGGNPGLALALLSLPATRTGAAPDHVLTAGELREATGAAELPGAGRWLDGLGAHALAVARAVAVLGADAEIAQTAELAGLPVRETLSAVDELVGRCLLANRTPLAFRHPLLAAMVIGGVPAGTRAALHLRAAEILRDGDFGVTRVAGQLVAAGPLGQEWTVRPLRLAARQLAQEGKAEDAARHLRGLLRQRLLPRLRAAVRRELASLDGFVDPDRTARHLDAARREAGDPEIAADYAVALAGLLTDSGRPTDAVAVLDDTADRLGAPGSPAHWRLRLHRASVCLDGPVALCRAGEPLDRLLADRPPDGGARRELAGLRAAHALRAGEDRAAAVRHAREALSHGTDGPGRAFWHGCETLVRADELVEAWTHCSRVRLAGGARPGRWDHVSAELLRAVICRARGELPTAERALAPMTELLTGAASTAHLVAARAVAVLVEVRALRGDTEAAQALLAGCGLDQELPPRQHAAPVLAARAVLREAAGEPDRALAGHLAAGRLLTDCRVRNPALAPWRSRAALLLAAAGECAEADRLARAELDDARRWGTPRAVGTAQHALAMAAGGPRRAELLAVAVATLARSPARLELAAARCDLGIALGRAGRTDEARAALDAALAAAGSCGARPLARRIGDARRELLHGDDGEPVPPALSGLTPQELRILGLARDGHTNRAIAGKLFVTVRTVEFHLSGAYRKLGISGRGQLPEILPPRAGDGR